MYNDHLFNKKKKSKISLAQYTNQINKNVNINSLLNRVKITENNRKKENFFLLFVVSSVVIIVASISFL